VLEIKADWLDKFKEALREAASVGTLVRDSLAVFSIMSLVSTPPCALVFAAASIWGLVRGWKVVSQSQVKMAQRELNQHLSLVLKDVRQHFLKVDPETDRQNLVDEFFNSLA